MKVPKINWMPFDKNNPPADLPYTHIEELNPIITELMNDWYDLVKKAKSYGMDIRFAPNCKETLELYFHDDYPDILLVDKEVSCKTV